MDKRPNKKKNALLVAYSPIFNIKLALLSSTKGGFKSLQQFLTKKKEKKSRGRDVYHSLVGAKGLSTNRKYSNISLCVYKRNQNG